MVAQTTTTELQQTADLVLREYRAVVLVAQLHPTRPLHKRQLQQFQPPIIMAHPVHMQMQAHLLLHRHQVTLITVRWARQVDQVEMEDATLDTAWVLPTIVLPAGRQS